MSDSNLPDAASFDPIILTLECLYNADAQLNNASLNLRCALLPDMLPATGVASQTAGLDSLLVQMHSLHLAINQVVDALAAQIEFAAPLDAEPTLP